MAQAALIIRSVVLSLIALTLVACSSTDGEEETGPAPLLDFEEERKFNKVWSSSVGDGQGGIFNRLNPAVDGDLIYVASAQGEIEAITVEAGKTVWDADLEQLLVGGVGVGENTIYVGTAAGEVVALNKDDGETLWSIELGGEVLAAPQEKDGIVYVQTFDGQMLALNVKDGERVWSFRNNLPVLTLRGTSTPLIYRDSIIAGFANGRVISFELDTGAVRWNTRVTVAKGDSEIQRIIDIDAPLLEHNGLIYAVSYQGKIAAIDPASGRRLWANDASSYAGMSLGFGNIYVVGEDGSVTAFEKNGQGARWAQTVLERRKLTGSAILSSYVIVGDVEGYLHALSQVDGRIAARTKVDSDGIQVDLQTVDDMLLVYSNGGKLVMYKLEEKSSGWF
ncbi:MAG: outer membrane protein assembly factor BamB [Oceanicoccus sp.]|uniref:outer membrane protein assembly factor BamB n=1 Tax=Oceanicoccus sp. TaxID=2691044 RepID=UPI002611940D|nr:outer membrane protein assembly factor BamB [Oceanicoccus sp.]MCP3907306.1 outer membrane protein assembly factor BamB [Oceanicoccus sp.]